MSCTPTCWELLGFHYETTLLTSKDNGGWKRTSVAPLSKENQENCKLVSSILVAGRMMKKIFMETVSKHMQDKMVIGSSQHGFSITNLFVLYNEMSGLVNGVSAVDSVYLDFSRVFNGVFHNILTEQLTEPTDKNDSTKGFT